MYDANGRCATAAVVRGPGIDRREYLDVWRKLPADSSVRKSSVIFYPSAGAVGGPIGSLKMTNLSSVS